MSATSLAKEPQATNLDEVLASRLAKVTESPQVGRSRYLLKPDLRPCGEGEQVHAAVL